MAESFLENLQHVSQTNRDLQNFLVQKVSDEQWVQSLSLDQFANLLQSVNYILKEEKELYLGYVDKTFDQMMAKIEHVEQQIGEGDLLAVQLPLANLLIRSLADSRIISPKNSLDSARNARIKDAIDRLENIATYIKKQSHVDMF